MPTISQLPTTPQVTAADLVPISQGGSACSVSVGAFLASTQPAILAPTGTLLGRTSLGPGGPDNIGIGTGLLLSADTLVATGADHAGFATEGTLSLTDDAVLSSSGTPKLLPLSLLRGLFSPGSNVSIDQNGTISAALPQAPSNNSASYSVTGLPTVASISSGDLVAISQSGTDHTITYANFIDGQTIDETPAATAVAGTDAFWVAQNGCAMSRQTFSAVWAWVTGNLPGYLRPVIELAANTTLSTSAHNGRILICSQPITVTVALGSSDSGFTCTLINPSGGNVTLSGNLVVSSGTPSLAPGQAAAITCATYSGGTLVYAWTTTPPSSLAAPAQVSGVVPGTVSANSITLNWTALSPAPASYTVQYRPTGTSGWWTAPSVTGTSCAVTGLLAGTSYDLTVSGVNSAGTGPASSIVTATTSGTLSVPGQVAAVTVGSPTANGLTISWSAPGSGGTVANYTIQYRVSGTTSWLVLASGLTTTTFAATGLLAATSYDFEVTAVNAGGSGPPSGVATASTAAAGTSVTSITWNIVPSGSYTHGSGVIAVNAHISPATAPVQFGFSTSATVPPTAWTLANFVNTDLWGAYVNTPSMAGTWYTWAEGTDGSATTVYATSFTVT